MKSNFISKEYSEYDLSELFKIIQREQVRLEDIEIIAVIINNNGEEILDIPHKEIGLSAKEFLQIIGGSSAILENAIKLKKEQYTNSVTINQKKEQKKSGETSDKDISNLFQKATTDPSDLCKTLQKNPNLLFVHKILKNEKISLLSHICTYNSLADINNNSHDNFLGIIKNINVSILNEEDRYFKLNSIFIQTLETNIKFSPCQKISALVCFTIQNFKLHKKDIKIFIDLLNLKIENIKSDNKNTIEIKQEALNNVISVVKLLVSKFLDETNSSIKEAINYAILDFKNISEKINLNIKEYINNIIEYRFNNLINSDKKMLPYLTNENHDDELVALYESTKKEFNQYAEYKNYKFSNNSYDILESVSLCHQVMTSKMFSRGMYKDALECFSYGMRLIKYIQDLDINHKQISENSKRFDKDLNEYYLSLRKSIKDSKKNKDENVKEYKEALEVVESAIASSRADSLSKIKIDIINNKINTEELKILIKDLKKDEIDSIYEKLYKFSKKHISPDLRKDLFEEIFNISGIMYDEKNTENQIENNSLANKNSYIEKFISPKISFKYKGSIKKAYYVTDIENGKKLYASVDSEKYTFKNAVKFGLAKTFSGSSGVKLLKNSKGEIAGYELKSISEQCRLFTNEVVLNKKDSEKDSEYAIILFNDKNECNHSKIKEVSIKSELELIYCDFEVNILGDQQHDL